MNDEKRNQLALFRYQVIAPLLSVITTGETLREEIQKASERYYLVPGSKVVRKYAFKTIENWYYQYKRGGIEFLKNASREDLGKSRALNKASAKEVERLLRERPSIDIPTILKELTAKGLAKEGEISESSLYRFRKALGLRKNDGIKGETYRAFAFEHPSDCWQADVLHGPCLPTKKGKARKTYLIAIIDDCTRLITHGQFYYAENLPNLADTLKQAIMKRGLTARLYIDNGKIFKSNFLLRVAATLGIHIIHSKPYRPEGRAKIERFFRTVRAQFLSRVEPGQIQDLNELNLLFWAWLEGEYHSRTHRGLGESPFDKWLRLSGFIRPLPPEIDLEMVFMHQDKRRVILDGTFQLKKCRFEAPLHLVGQKIDVHYNPEDLRMVHISLDGKKQGVAYPVDLHANSFVRREQPKPKENITAQPLTSLHHLKNSMEKNHDTSAN